MNPKISVLIPSIRQTLLKGVYDSISESFHEEWELVIVSPYPLPDSLKDKKNIIYIKDHGSPIRARQIGLIDSTGDYICYAADDVLFYPQALDMAYHKVKDSDYKTIVLGKYREGEEINPFMDSDEYYYLNIHDALKEVTKNLPDNYKLLNTGLISRKLMLEVGGFDCQFEACAMACVDLSIRLQNYGAKIIFQHQPFFKSTHLPGHDGDHQPIHDAQIMHDQPVFMMIYTNPDNVNRTLIPINNWQKTSSWWDRRFGVKGNL